MEVIHQKTERAILKLVIGVLGALVILVVVCVEGSSLYHRWQERRSLARAGAYLNRGEYRLAALSARRAIDLNAKDPEPVRLLARVAERVSDPSALDWRRKAVELAPNSNDDRIALALCALQFKNLDAAQQALSAIPPNDQQTGAFQAAAAQVAEARHDKEGAEADWAKAVQLEPNNGGYRLQLALSRVALDDAAKHAAGVELLSELRSNPEQRVAATRALITDAVTRRGDAIQVKQMAFELQGYPEAAFSDRLLYLDILRQLSDPEYTKYLSETEEIATKKAADLAALLAWMSRANLVSLSIDFISSLPAEKLQDWPMPLVVGNCYAAAGQWSKLEALATKSNWNGFEYLRHAFLARALREQNKLVKAEGEWAEARKSAGSSQQLLTLAQTVAEWQWSKETDELLWELVNRPESQAEALQTLYKRHTRTGDTVGLYKVLSRLYELHPNDRTVQNNFAQVCLLLNVERERARKIAADLHRDEPGNAAFTATYAFSLYRDSKAAQAVAVMSSLRPEQLADPAISFYYGVFLSAVGDAEKAHEYLERGKNSAMLPEEQQLLAEAKRRAHIE